MYTRRFLLGYLLLGLTQCNSPGETAPERVPPESPTPGLSREAPPDPGERERRLCERRLAEVMAEPGLPGARRFEEHRLEILTQAKASPMLLVDTPEHAEPATATGDEAAVSPEARSFRKLLHTTDHPWDALQRLLPNFQQFPKNGRDTLLREGYLYADDPKLAFALVNLVGARHLFDQEQIWVKRGEELYHAKRRRGTYYFIDGPNAGERVRLLLLDRIGYGPPPTHTLLRDVRALKYRLHFDRAEVLHLTENNVVAKLFYGETSVPTVLKSAGANLSVECEVLRPEVAEQVTRARNSAARRLRVVQALRQTMLTQIDEKLPFDEPRREFGFQLDGRLRTNWLHAYMNGKSSYAFNGDRYKVFDSQGRPLVPQVCVDFLTDTFERSSGSWYRSKDEGPGRSVGALDYDKLDLLARAKLRRIPGFLEHARLHPDRFGVLDIGERERVKLGDRAAFVQDLLVRRESYQPGDILIVRGFTPWDPEAMHYHSFFVYESDPLSGIPLSLVGNAGRPSVRYWEVEARRTPEREIWHRVRPTTAWLESILPQGVSPPSGPLPLSPRGNDGTE